MGEASGLGIFIFIWLLVFGTHIFQILALYLDFEGAKNIHVLLVFIWGFGGRWRFLTWVCILLLIWIWSLVFEIPMIRIVALYLDFEGAKNIHVLSVLFWGFGGCWRFLTGVWHLDIDLDLVTWVLYTHVPNFGFLSPFIRCKEHPCPLSPHLELWRTLEVPDWGFGILILIFICSLVFDTPRIKYI